MGSSSVLTSVPEVTRPGGALGTEGTVRSTPCSLSLQVLETESEQWVLGPGRGRVRGHRVMGTEFPIGKTDVSGDRWWGRLHNSVNSLHAAELCTWRWLKCKCCVICTLPQLKTFFLRKGMFLTLKTKQNKETNFLNKEALLLELGLILACFLGPEIEWVTSLHPTRGPWVHRDWGVR